MALTLIYRTSSNALDSIALDATLSEQHTSASDVTDHPVERGAAVVDHVRDRPASVRIEGVLADFPLGDASAARASISYGRAAEVLDALGANYGWLSPPTVKVEPGTANAGARGRGVEILEQLERLRRAATLIEVRSGLRTYRDMVIQTIDVPRSAALGSGVKFSATLREVRLVDSQLVPVKVSKLRAAQSKQNGGKQATTEATDKERKRSLLIKIGDALGNLTGGK